MQTKTIQASISGSILVGGFLLAPLLANATITSWSASWIYPAQFTYTITDLGGANDHFRVALFTVAGDGSARVCDLPDHAVAVGLGAGTYTDTLLEPVGATFYGAILFKKTGDFIPGDCFDGDGGGNHFANPPFEYDNDPPTPFIILAAAPPYEYPTPGGGGGGGSSDGSLDGGVTITNFAYTTPVPAPSGGGEVAGTSTEGTATGEVLGASTSTPSVSTSSTSMCTSNEEYLHDYLGAGKKNNPEEVKKLQQFLGNNLGLNITSSGIFDQSTLTAVMEFQVKYWQEILAPWMRHGLPNEKHPTGYVYKTTKRWINMLSCPTLNLPQPELP